MKLALLIFSGYPVSNLNEKKSYQQILICGKGGPEVLTFRPTSLPKRLRANELLIETEACGVAFGDRMRRLGLLAPPWNFVAGYDAVGKVIDAGHLAQQDFLGKRVAVFMPKIGLGGYSQLIKVSAKAAFVVEPPDQLSAQVILALGLNYVSAYQMLSRFQPLNSKAKIFVHGISGNVGRALIDLCAVLDLSLSGTCSGKNIEKMQSLLTEKNIQGAVYSYQNPQYQKQVLKQNPSGFDLVLDGLGGQTLKFSRKLIAKSGRLISFGITQDVSKGYLGVARGMSFLVSDFFMAKPVSLYAIGLNRNCHLKNIISDWGFMLKLYREGKLNPHLGKIFSFSEIAEAHAALEDRNQSGKIILNSI